MNLRYLIAALALCLVTAAHAQSGKGSKAADAEPPRPNFSIDELKGMIRSTLVATKPSDTAPSPGPSNSTPGRETCPCCGQPMPAGKSKPSTVTTGATGPAREVVIIGLRGSFDEVGLCGTISPLSFDIAMDLALERKPAAIILDINSPGGLVWIMEHVVDRLLKVQTESGIPVIAWPELAGSAAAVTCMTCKHIVVRPTTVMGAATKIKQDGTAAPQGETALDNKMASVEQARRRQIAQITGRDLQVLDAMQYPDRTLWFSPAGGFRTDSCGDCLALDTSKTIPATLNAEELVRTGIARGTAVAPPEVLRAAGLPPASPTVRIDFCDPALQAKIAPIQNGFGKWNEWARARLAEFRTRLMERTTKIDHAIQQVDALSGGNGWSESQQQKLQTALENCKNLPKLPASIEQYMDDSSWMACKRSCYEHALHEFQLAVSAGTPRSAGAGRTIVDLDTARQHLVEGYNQLVRLLNGCPDE